MCKLFHNLFDLNGLFTLYLSNRLIISLTWALSHESQTIGPQALTSPIKLHHNYRNFNYSKPAYIYFINLHFLPLL